MLGATTCGGLFPPRTKDGGVDTCAKALTVLELPGLLIGHALGCFGAAPLWDAYHLDALLLARGYPMRTVAASRPTVSRPNAPRPPCRRSIVYRRDAGKRWAQGDNHAFKAPGRPCLSRNNSIVIILAASALSALIRPGSGKGRLQKRQCWLAPPLSSPVVNLFELLCCLLRRRRLGERRQHADFPLSALTNVYRRPNDCLVYWGSGLVLPGNAGFTRSQTHVS
jgi:hypothetical protein